MDPTSKVSFLAVDFSSPDFGLPSQYFSDLRDDVDAIIHNAWKVDFNHALQSFEETHIKGVRNFIDRSIAFPKHPGIFFVSFISSVGNTPAERGPVSKEPHTDYDPEWLPCLIKSSLELGSLPDSLPVVDWIPVDVLAGIMVDILHARNPFSSEEKEENMIW